MEHRFWQVDAFSAEPYLGNPAAVVFDADDLSTDEMQTIARQFNLSETVFLCSPSMADADYRARIFSPTREMPFAGHPTVAAAYAHVSTRPDAVPESGGTLRQECGAGLVPVTVSEGPLFTLAADAEPAVATGLGRTQIAELIGCAAADICADPAEVCSIGLPWLIARIDSLEALSAATPDLNLIDGVCGKLGATGITVYSAEAALDDCDIHVRTFAPGVGIKEDPACGSGNGAIAIHLARHLHRDRPSFSFRAEQGLEIHRRARLHVGAERGRGNGSLVISVGGRAVRVMEGRISGG